MEVDHMWIISTVIVGLIAGALARLIMPGRDPMGILMTIVLGIIGSFVGGFLYRLIFHPPADGSYFHPGGLLLSVLGAILVLFIWRMMSRRT